MLLVELIVKALLRDPSQHRVDTLESPDLLPRTAHNVCRSGLCDRKFVYSRPRCPPYIRQLVARIFLLCKVMLQDRTG